MSKSLDYFIGNPDYASSPRELLTEFLRERKIRPETFARDMEISETDLSRLLSDDSPWSDDTIQKIERATGVPASLWVNAEKNYRRCNKTNLRSSF